MDKKCFIKTAGDELVSSFGLSVIFPFASGVVYIHQCAGLNVEYRRIEGFAVSIGGDDASRPFIDFFEKFQGYPPRSQDGGWDPAGHQWSQEDLELLGTAVGNLSVRPPTLAEERGLDLGSEWLTEPVPLKLDLSRLVELTEAWIPVLVGGWQGYLIFMNSD